MNQKRKGRAVGKGREEKKTKDRLVLLLFQTSEVFIRKM